MAKGSLKKIWAGILLDGLFRICYNIPMRTFCLLISLLFIICSSLFASPTITLKIEADVINIDRDMDNTPNHVYWSQARDSTTKKIAVSIRNTSPLAISNVKVVWKIYSKDMQNGRTSLMTGGIEIIDNLKTFETKVIETSPFNFSSKKHMHHGRICEKEGSDFAGYSIQAFKNDILVGEYWSSTNLKISTKDLKQ